MSPHLVFADLVPGDLMEHRLSELRDRLHYAESLNQDRESDIQTLRQQLNILMKAPRTQNNGYVILWLNVALLYLILCVKLWAFIIDVMNPVSNYTHLYCCILLVNIHDDELLSKWDVFIVVCNICMHC